MLQIFIPFTCFFVIILKHISNIFKHKVVLLALLGILKTVSAQLRIDTLHTAEYAIKSVLLGKYEGLKIENIKYSGDRKSLGIFLVQWVITK